MRVSGAGRNGRIKQNERGNRSRMPKNIQGRQHIDEGGKEKYEIEICVRRNKLYE